MTRRRILLPAERIEADRGLLDAAARHYLRDVLRLSPGDAVEVFDGRGGRFGGRILAGFDAISLGPREEAPRSPAEVTLLFALAKGEKNDLVVEKATELGAACVAPFAAERSVVRLDASKGEERARRWRRVAEAAARQCGRDDVPAIRAPAPLDEALAALAPGTRTFAFHPGGAPIGSLCAAPVPALAAVVGPEGGLGEREIAACERAGALRASLGPRTLRAETAAIVALALLQARFGDLA